MAVESQPSIEILVISARREAVHGNGLGKRHDRHSLFAAGITGGCGSGNFCPDGPLTRGQMAVFLSAALGLHVPELEQLLTSNS